MTVHYIADQFERHDFNPNKVSDDGTQEVPKHIEHCVPVVLIFQCTLSWSDKLNLHHALDEQYQNIKLCDIFRQCTFDVGQSRWPRGLRRGSAAVCLLGLRVRILSGAWVSVVSVVCYQVELCTSG